MSARRGDPVAPPPGPDEFHVRFGTKEAADGWRDLCAQAPGAAIRAWELMRTNPAPHPQTSRHHRLRHDLAEGVYQGESLPQWQIEATGGGRIWYLFDAARRTCWLRLVRVGHPRQTD